MINIKQILEQKEKELLEVQKTQRKEAFINVSYDDFKELFISFGTIELQVRNKGLKFIIDEENEKVIDMLYKYNTSQTSKSILLSGAYGTGKSVIMKTYSEIVNYFAENLQYGNKIKFIRSVDLIDLKTEDILSMIKKPCIIDEVGRETSIKNDYGTKTSPFVDFIERRYENGVNTHFVSNKSLDDLKLHYGKMLGDRFSEMFYFFEIKGNSRRK